MLKIRKKLGWFCWIFNIHLHKHTQNSKYYWKVPASKFNEQKSRAGVWQAVWS